MYEGPNDDLPDIILYDDRHSNPNDDSHSFRIEYETYRNDLGKFQYTSRKCLIDDLLSVEIQINHQTVVSMRETTSI